ncbi:cupin domain-containing protein [Sphingomonas bacterium]|uniref:cupin domain-containing protein n=1 Tax=Sphingomonas bacterium TaxID=1895847 RepID=UPI0015751ECB|nr:cupin domain-containing protein [Sphingomonas bacterium]
MDIMTDVAPGLHERLIRYAALRPCLNAFVDSRTPGSDQKENFCIIGPGVSENPSQHVHMAEPHGFNIGGARQTPGCMNSQHSHETAEIFVVHSGNWRFDFGENGGDAQVFVAPGDVISLPMHAFRGFTNVGGDSGFLWSLLGGDDPGRVLWAPQVFDLATHHGLILLKTGQLVDTIAGEIAPAGIPPMPRTTSCDIARLRRIAPSEAEAMVFRGAVDRSAGELPVIGPAALLHADEVRLVRLRLTSNLDRLDRPGTPEVLFVHEGLVTVARGDDELTLRPGDTLSVPAGPAYRLTAASATLFAASRA